MKQSTLLLLATAMVSTASAANKRRRVFKIYTQKEIHPDYVENYDPFIGIPRVLEEASMSMGFLAPAEMSMSMGLASAEMSMSMGFLAPAEMSMSMGLAPAEMSMSMGLTSAEMSMSMGLTSAEMSMSMGLTPAEMSMSMPLSTATEVKVTDGEGEFEVTNVEGESTTESEEVVVVENQAAVPSSAMLMSEASVALVTTIVSLITGGLVALA